MTKHNKYFPPAIASYEGEARDMFIYFTKVQANLRVEGGRPIIESSSEGGLNPEARYVYYVHDSVVKAHLLPYASNLTVEGQKQDGVGDNRATLRLTVFAAAPESQSKTLDALIHHVGLHKLK
jgi:hypothetical protein